MEESLILSKFDSLVESGLVLYDHKQENIEHIDAGLKFQFILTSALAKKPTIQIQPSAQENGEVYHERREGSDISTSGFEIGDVGSTHFVAASKFCFARPHLMLLTSNGHRKQFEALDEADLGAAWSILSSFRTDYVAFYNCGQDGGCSRLHKHIQLMPMPTSSFASFLDSKDSKEPSVPFQWFYQRFTSKSTTPAMLTEIYTHLLKQATEAGQGRPKHADSALSNAAYPHNMILTNRWMVVLPRQRAAVNKEAGVNAMGMLGIIAVATQGEINNWVRLGLTEALKGLGVSK